MKYIRGIVALVVVVAAGFGTPAHADTNNFRITQFEADYYLTRTHDNRSQLKTVEKITADFPDYDQNHGIERALPMSYDGHSTRLAVISVTDEKGTARPYVTSESNGNEVLRIGDKSSYAHGETTYVITYTQQDVTKQFAGRDEFYWDSNGTEWQQPFDLVTARIHLSPDEVGALNGDAACYRGAAGAADKCIVTANGAVLSATVGHLNVGENMTLAVGFKPHSFAGYQPTLWERLVQVWVISLIFTSIVGFVVLFWLSIRYSAWSNRKKDIGTIVPEYLPPKTASVLVSERIVEDARAGMTAQIIDLAVRHYVKLYQTQEKALFKSAEYELEIVKAIDTLSQDEQDFVTTIFGAGNTQPGSRFEMKKLKSDYKVAAALQKNTKVTDARIKGEYGLRAKDAARSKWFMRTATVLAVVGVLTVSPLVLIAAIVAAACGNQLYPLTDEGLALRRYLEGLKLYIGVAEQERLKMLQSPEGAEKSGVKSADNPKQLVKLYERVLPYAVLFGQEKEWNKQLGQYYEQASASPDWYSGQTAFNAAVFSTAMSDFSATTNSYAASSNSSSSGSSGGGFSGGGGGGGGGGGW